VPFDAADLSESPRRNQPVTHARPRKDPAMAADIGLLVLTILLFGLLALAVKGVERL
jgi:hypothetical protein